MDTITMGDILSIMVMALIATLFFLVVAISRYLYYKAETEELTAMNIERVNLVLTKHQQIVSLKKDLKLTQDYLAEYISTSYDQAELINLKDEELDCKDADIRQEKETAQIYLMETFELRQKLEAAQKETPDHLRACLIRKIAKVANQAALITLLENANNEYAHELKVAMQEIDKLRAEAAINEEPDEDSPDHDIKLTIPYPAEESKMSLAH